jgi:hypothetical protein
MECPQWLVCTNHRLILQSFCILTSRPTGQNERFKPPPVCLQLSQQRPNETILFRRIQGELSPV